MKITKKILTTIFILIMLLSFAACGDSGLLSGNTASAYSLTDILSGEADISTIYSQMSAAEKKLFSDEAKKEGADVSFDADGSMTIKDADGSEIVQNKDGTWTYSDADGNKGQYGGDWPDNEYTKLLPKPDFGILATGVEAEEFTVTFTSNVTLDGVRSYAEKLKNKGFTRNALVTDETVFGMTVYSFEAENENGYAVSFGYSMGVAYLTLSKSSGNYEDNTYNNTDDYNSDTAYDMLNQFDFSSINSIDDYYKAVSDTENNETKAPEKLGTPWVAISEHGQAYWYTLSGFTINYCIRLNGVEQNLQNVTIDLKEGDRIQVKALGDGKTTVDSDWSTEQTFKRSEIYDFTDIGLSAPIEAILTSCEKKEPGQYSYSKGIKCDNGDIIVYRGNSWIDIFTRNDGYKRLTLVFNYMNDTATKKTTDYELTDYRDNKVAYYTELAGSVAAMIYESKGEGEHFADYNAFIASQGITLLAHNAYEPDNLKAYEMEKYTEYSGNIDIKYLNTTYLHKTRSLGYLDKFKEKIASWSIERVNVDDNYSDNKVTVTFKDSFSSADYGELLKTLQTEGIVPLEGNSMKVNENAINVFEGYIPVYSFPYEEEGDTLNDEYKIMGGNAGGYSTPYTLTAQYTYMQWYDGGSFATYIVKPTGLWRIPFENVVQLMIAPDGKVYDYIKTPKATLNNYKFSYTTNAEYDAEIRSEGGIPSTYTVEKADDKLVYCEKTDYGTTWLAARRIGDTVYTRYGTSYEGAAIEWNEFDYYYSFDDICYELYELLCMYYNAQFKCSESGSGRVAGLACKKYTRAEDGYTYTYFVTEDGVTLKYVETDGEYVQTREILSADLRTAAFSPVAAKIYAESGLSSYVPTER